MDAREVIELLKLQKHPVEGGWFRETYRSNETIAKGALPDRFPGARNISTLIYYLITQEGFSGFHRVKSDEIFHFYLGDPAILSIIQSDGTLEQITLGANIASGHVLQALVPVGLWQAIHLQAGGKWALLGASVSPGFNYEDLEDGRSDALLKEFPQHAQLILQLS